MQGNNIDDLYKNAISKVLDNGESITARGLKFKELTFQHLVLTNPRARIVTNQRRKLNLRFMAAEFIWIMSGSPWLDMISFYNQNYAQFSDDGISLHGAYGPRLRHWNIYHGDVDQLDNCLQRLKNDIYTRQAVMVILDPSIDFTEKTKDVPCNNYLQFLYRGDKLHLMCYVRSNDLNWGFPYDVYHWTMLQEMYASILGVEVGDYHHIVGSLHIYDKDISTLREVSECPTTSLEDEKMPLLDDFGLIDTLELIEASYRKTGKLDLGSFNLGSYWETFMKRLIK